MYKILAGFGSIVRSLWMVFSHVTRKRDTILYPEVPGEQIVPPRFRGPAGEISGPRTEQVGGEIAEGFVFKIGKQQFAHRAHDEKQHKADDHIHEDNGRTGKADGFSGAHKQAGTDGTADSNQLNMAVREVSPQAFSVLFHRLGEDF